MAVDCPEQGVVPYQLATKEDLDETVRAVEELDQRILAVHGDVRQQAAVDAAVERGIAEFGQIDCVVANAAASTPCSG